MNLKEAKNMSWQELWKYSFLNVVDLILLFGILYLFKVLFS
jgi:hypothetical protein